MKLQPDNFDVQAITGYGPGWVGVGSRRLVHSAVVDARGALLDWDAVRFEDLGERHFALLLDLRPEVVIFGSGTRLRFPRPAWVRPLTQAGIGVETMDTQAACRTYNILAQEGRHVTAALLLEPEA